MINRLLDVLLDRSPVPEVDHLKQGIERLVRARASDHDPINRSQPGPDAAAI
jgi:hypothetical protein